MKLALALLLSAFTPTLPAQTPAIHFHPAVPHFIGSVFDLQTDGDTLEGVFIGDRHAARPLILFIQGSGPAPLFGSVGDSVFHPLFPWQLLEDTAHFNFVFLSKPGIPAVCALDRLDERYEYHAGGKTGPAPGDYLAHNTLEHYVAAYTTLLDHVNEIGGSTSITVMGHSQGARIAAELATHPAVGRLVYMSADPLGRLATLYDAEYAKFDRRDPDKARLLHGLMDPAMADSLYRGERYASFRSFAKPSLISLANAKVPTLLVYGDRDESCPNCYALSLLPAWFPRMQVLSYPGYDHNYFDPDGKNHWDEVVAEIFRWILGN